MSGPFSVQLQALEPVDGIAAFNLIVQCDEMPTWQVKKSLQDFEALHQTLVTEKYSSTLPDFPQEADRDSVLLEYFQNILQLFGNHIWNCYPLLRFLDESPTPSKIAQLQMMRMSAQIEYLLDTALTYERKIGVLESNSTKFETTIEQLQTAIEGLRKTLAERPASDKNLVSLDDVNLGLDRRQPLEKTISAVTEANFAESEIKLPLRSEKRASISSEASEGDLPMGWGTAAMQSFSSDLGSSLDLVNSSTELLEEIMRALQPHEAQLRYRASAVGLLKKHIRNSLGANAFEVGLHELRCFLPDDPIKLTVIISRGHTANWHTNLIEGLNQPADSQIESILEYVPLTEHLTSNISLSNDMSKVLCTIDSLDVEIVANCRTDLCMLAFFEEVAALVGQDNLFKRSLLLIRGWWMYETASYVGASIKHYLSDFSLCVMVCAIFNQHHRVIKNPLHALCLFLGQYSEYNGSTHAITLQGIVPFKSVSGNQPGLITPRPDDLIASDIIEKHWKIYNVNQSTHDVPTPQFSQLASSSDDNIVMDQLIIDSPFSFVSDRFMNSNLHNFTRLGFNIVHPFENTNMVNTTMTNKRLMRLVKAFQIGAANLSAAIKPAADADASVANVKNFFPAALARLGDNWRPDVVGNLLPSGQQSDYKLFDNGGSSKDKDIMVVSFDRLWQNIYYCNLIVESIVTEPALFIASCEVLAVKGPLPVGEIGKVLAELSSISDLPTKLKELFGGLKKFLERYPDAFVFSTDHPFNPHVFLRASLSAESLEMIEKGIFPEQLMMKYRSKVPPSKKAATVSAAANMGMGTKLNPSSTSFTPSASAPAFNPQSNPITSASKYSAMMSSQQTLQSKALTSNSISSLNPMNHLVTGNTTTNIPTRNAMPFPQASKPSPMNAVTNTTYQYYQAMQQQQQQLQQTRGVPLTKQPIYGRNQQTMDDRPSTMGLSPAYQSQYYGGGGGGGGMGQHPSAASSGAPIRPMIPVPRNHRGAPGPQHGSSLGDGLILPGSSQNNMLSRLRENSAEFVNGRGPMSKPMTNNSSFGGAFGTSTSSGSLNGLGGLNYQFEVPEYNKANYPGPHNNNNFTSELFNRPRSLSKDSNSSSARSEEFTANDFDINKSEPLSSYFASNGSTSHLF